MSKSSKPVSEIDRLIELASDEKPAAGGRAARLSTNSLSVEDLKEPRPSMWRVLLQLRVLLPYLAKVLPLVERGLLGTNISAQALAGHAPPNVDAAQIERGIASVGEAQRDLNTAVKAQAAEIQLLQEQVVQLTRSIEKDLLLNEQNAASLGSLRKLLTTSVWVIFVLLAVLIGLMVFAIVGLQPRVG